MPLDPQCQSLIERITTSGTSPFDQADPEQARAAYRKSIALYTHPTPELGSVEDTDFEGPAGAIALRIYRPKRNIESNPAIVFFHGGGWAVGDLDTHDHVCRYLAAHAQAIVISVDYRLAPEHPFPAPVDDCLAAVRWVHRNAETLKIDRPKIAVAGDSAGGNLAAAVALALRDDREINLCFQLLIYPACDFTAEHASLRENGNDYFLTQAALQQFTEWYLPHPDDWHDYRASPQLADSHSRLPAAFVVTAEFDPLRDEGNLYAETLRAAGTAVSNRCYPGMIHGFARMGAKLDCAITCLADCVQHLDKAFR